MNRTMPGHDYISVFLAAVLFFFCLQPGLMALAAETGETEETIPVTTAAPVTEEATIPVTQGNTESTLPSTTGETREETQTSESSGATVSSTASTAETTTVSTTAGTAATMSETTCETASAAEETEPSDPFGLTPPVLWYAVSPEDLLPGDVVAITLRIGDAIFALDSGCGPDSPPQAVPVTVENGVMLSAAAISWRLSRQDRGLVLKPAGSDSFLYADISGDALRAGAQGDPFWRFSGNTLQHVLTGRYLTVNSEAGFWFCSASPGPALSFWRLERTAPVTAVPASGEVTPDSPITLSCGDPSAGIYYALSSDGITYSDFLPYTGPLFFGTNQEFLYIKAYAGTEGKPPSAEQCFSYRKQLPPAQKPDWEEPYHCYFGQLHGHSSLSDATGSPEAVFQFARNIPGLDFFALTDHSDSFDHSLSGSLSQEGSAISAAWARGKTAAAKATDGNFVGIFGFEMSFPETLQFGHIGTFATPGWQSWQQEDFSTLDAYYQALASQPGAIGQFHHPGGQYGTFLDFAPGSAALRERMALLEIGGEGSFRAYGAYDRALSRGWRVAPTNNQSLRYSEGCTLGPARTVVLASALTESALYEAIRSRRVYASDDSDLQIYYTLNGSPMGSVLPRTGSISISVRIWDPTDEPVGRVAVIGENGAVLAEEAVERDWAELSFTPPSGHSYYYLRVTQPDGDIAVTAPVWLETYENMGIRSFSCGTALPLQGEEVTLTALLFNETSEDLVLSSLECFLGETSLYRSDAPGSVPAAGENTFTFSYSRPEIGPVSLRLVAKGTVRGIPKSFEKTLTLTFQPKEPEGGFPLSTIADIRSGADGSVFRVLGYVTLGTSRPGNRFPGTLCLQDSSGGIFVVDFPDTDIPVGTPVELLGQKTLRDGNIALSLLRYEISGEPFFRYVPKQMPARDAMDYEAFGGQLLQVEGTVASLRHTPDGLGISHFELTDGQGDIASVLIDPQILSGSTGKNTLASTVKPGRTVRAAGILILAENAPVLLVRNCDEVTYVPPVPDLSNPRVGDRSTVPMATLVLSGTGLLLLLGRKRKRGV